MSSVVPYVRDVAPIPGAAARIRPLTEGDVVELADTYWRSYRQESPGFTLAHATQDIARILSGHHGRVVAEASLLAVVDGRAAGAVITVIDPPYPATPAGPYIVDLYVVPAERRRGVGGALVLHAVSALGGRTVHLRVDDGNGAAVQLYTAHGFTPVAFAAPDSPG